MVVSIYPIKQVKLMPLKREKLSNGVKIYTLQSDASDVIKIDIIFPKAGSDYDKQTLQATFANMLVKEATTDKNSDEVAEFFDFYGSIVEYFSGTGKSGLRLTTTKQFFDVVFPLFSELILSYTINNNDFQTIKKRYTENLKTSFQKTSYLAYTNLNTVIFGDNNPRGRKITLKDVELFDIEQARTFMQKYYKANNCLIFITGAANDNEINLVKTLFSTSENVYWNNNTKIHFPKLKYLPAEQKNHYIKLEEAVQSSVILGIKFPKLNDLERANLNILNTILGGYFGSRLMKNIREDKGYTYSIYSQIVEYDDCSVMKIFTEVSCEYAEDTISEIFKEIKKLQSKELNNPELETVKNYMLGDVLSATDGIFNQAEVWKSLILNNKGINNYNLTIKTVKNFTAEDMIFYAKKFLIIKDFFVVVAGN